MRNSSQEGSPPLPYGGGGVLMIVYNFKISKILLDYRLNIKLINNQKQAEQNLKKLKHNKDITFEIQYNDL